MMDVDELITDIRLPRMGVVSPSVVRRAVVCDFVPDLKVHRTTSNIHDAVYFNDDND